MTKDEKIEAALQLLEQIKWGKDSSWLSAARIVDEVTNLLRSPSTQVPGTNAAAPRPRAGLSDRLIALIGKRSGNTRAIKTPKVKG